MTINSNKFHWHKETKTMSAEISELETGNAVPTNISMVSARTGKQANFQLAKTDKDNEGDVRFWEYVPQCLSRGCGVEKVVIFND